MRKRGFRLRGEKGYTLIEMTVVLVLMPLLFLSLYTIVDMARVIFHMDGVYSDLNQGTMQILRSICREMGQSSPLVAPQRFVIATGEDSNSIVRFQIPVDWDNDGDAVTDNLSPAIEWGGYLGEGQTQDGILNGWIRYRVEEGRLIREALTDGLALIDGSEKIVANNVERFLVVQETGSLEKVNVMLDLSRADMAGQSGEPRRITSSFTSRTYLRNAVA